MPRARSSAQDAPAGAGATLLGFAGAAAWALLVSVGYFRLFAAGEDPVLTGAAFAAAALGPIVLILFGALAAREAARTRALTQRIANIAETAVLAPSADALLETRALAAALRGEVEALDAIVHVTTRRLDAFETGLRADGGVLARALADDVETIGRVRSELNQETVAVGEAVNRHVAALRESAARFFAESQAAAATVDLQLETFGAVSAKIGVRSAEFAAAADLSARSSGKLDAAVDKALAALAHATSLTDTARKSAEQAALVAHEAAGAVRGATRTAVAEARDAAKRIRAEAGAAAAPMLGRILSGAAHAANLAPPPLATLRAGEGGKVIAMKRAAQSLDDGREPSSGASSGASFGASSGVNAAGRAERAPETISRAPAPLTLADIVNASGLSLANILSAEALDHIAQAARRGAEARRAMVRAVAPQPLRNVSIYLRRDAHARHDAEALRADPARALGGAHEPESRRRDLASAYLLVDTVLG